MHLKKQYSMSEEIKSTESNIERVKIEVNDKNNNLILAENNI
jgi:hypothetical protein